MTVVVGGAAALHQSDDEQQPVTHYQGQLAKGLRNRGSEATLARAQLGPRVQVALIHRRE